jgi:uncharacterized protein (TIGR00266 family)
MNKNKDTKKIKLNKNDKLNKNNKNDKLNKNNKNDKLNKNDNKIKKGGSLENKLVSSKRTNNMIEKIPQQVSQQTSLQKTNNNKIFNSNKITLIKDPFTLKNNKEFPSFIYEAGTLKVSLKQGESIRADAGAMNYMTDSIQLETKTGSIFNAMWRTASGSSLFYNIFYNQSPTLGSINLSRVTPGVVHCFYIPQGRNFCFVDDTYVASTTNLRITTKARFGGLIMGYGLTFVNVMAENGSGLVWIDSFGDIINMTIKSGNSLRVDNGVLLGFDSDIPIETETVGGFVSTFFSGEGLVSRIRNNTNSDINIYLQTISRIGFNNYIANIAKSNTKKIELF